MKLKNLFWLCTLISLILTVSASAAPTEAETLKDWNSLYKSYKDVEQQLEDTIPVYSPTIMGSDYGKIFALLENYDKNTEPKLQKQLDDFSKKYGKNATEINDTIKSIVKLDFHSGKHPTTEAGYTYESLRKLIENVKQAKLNKANGLIQEAESVKSIIDSFDTQVTRENFDKELADRVLNIQLFHRQARKINL